MSLAKEIDDYLDGNGLWKADWPIAASLLERASERLKQRSPAPSASTNSASTKLRKIIIELGCRGVIGAGERDTAIVDEICKREGIVL